MACAHHNYCDTMHMQSMCLIELCRSCTIQLVSCVQDVLARVFQPINIVVVDTLSQYIILCGIDSWVWLGVSEC